MSSSMRTITDINLDGRAVDLAAEGTLTFTNNCDSLSFIAIDFYDMDSHAKTTYTLGDGSSSSWQRGDTVRFALKGLAAFKVGRDYMGVATVYQSQPNVAESESSPGRYDVYMGAGRVQQDSSSATEIYIDRDISFIVSPVRRNNKLVGGCVLRLNDRDLLIESYDPETGKATVGSARINGSSYSARATKQGEVYKLITNYLVCDAFTFYYRTEPKIELSHKITANGIEVTGKYSQAEGTALQSWKMTAAYTYDQSGDIKIIERETKFGYVISDVFPILATNSEYDVPAHCQIICEITTQDNYTKTAELSLNFKTESTISVVADGTSVTAEGFPGGTMFVWRQENWKADGTSYGYHNLKYIGSSDTGHLYSRDAGHGQSYRYIVCVADKDGGLHFGTSEDVTIAAKTWSIERLVKTGDRAYRVDGNGFTFSVDVQPGSIETVTGNAIYGSEGRFPKYICGSDRYDTGSFTALLGSITEQEATAYTIERWCEFISQEGPFLLKTDSGDVKIVAITGNPTRQYGSSLAELGITRVTYSWAEVEDIEQAVIR